LGRQYTDLCRVILNSRLGGCIENKMKKTISWKLAILIGCILTALVACTNTNEIDRLNLEVDELNETILINEAVIKGLLTSLNNSNTELAMLNENITNMEKFNEKYMKALQNYYIAESYSDLAEYNYETFAFNWDNSFLQGSIDACRMAREQYADANGRYDTAVTYFEQAEKYGKEEIIKYYILISKTSINLNWAMYEACEYFESSASNYMRGNYAGGDSELDKANKKIKEHDKFINSYNSYNSKIEVLST